jgi:hypothetical protein
MLTNLRVVHRTSPDPLLPRSLRKVPELLLVLLLLTVGCHLPDLLPH